MNVYLYRAPGAIGVATHYSRRFLPLIRDGEWLLEWEYMGRGRVIEDSNGKRIEAARCNVVEDILSHDLTYHGMKEAST